ncbi:MAG: elongation factor G [Oscillospiraceae bacterium]|nr:elongation factor G [Oscillospiraceae bacterium]
MKQYPAEKIKNIAVAGAGGEGKTSLVEAMLFAAGATDRMGKVLDGNTVCDFEPEEIKRNATLTCAVAPFEYQGVKFNIIDTPGLFDFAAGMNEGIGFADTVLIAVSAKSGALVGTKKAFKMAKKLNKSRMFCVTKLDSEGVDFYKTVDNLKEAFGSCVCPLIVPHYENGKITSYIDLVDMKAYKSDGKGKMTGTDMPGDLSQYEEMMNAVKEVVAETDENLMEKFFAEEEFTREELELGIKNGIKSGEICPVYCGCPFEPDSMELFLKALCGQTPSANEVSFKTEDGKEIKCDENAPAAVFVFKTVADPFVGKLSFLRVLSGAIKSDSTLHNASGGQNEKIGKLLFVFGKKNEDVKEISAGDIGVATKLTVNTNDTLCAPANPVKVAPIEYPAPCYSKAVFAKSQGDESKISSGMQRLLEEDPTLSYENNAETHQQILSGLGEQHLDVCISKLKNKFGVDVNTAVPIIAYRETIRKKIKVQGRHKKQTGGHGQFGDVWIEFEPCDDDDLIFEEKIFGGAVPKGYFPAVEKGLRESAQKGVLAGYPVVGLKAILVDGSYHDVDSSEMSFKLAASIAYRTGIEQASPILLEPIGSLKVAVPDSNTGDIMGELNKLRGRVLGMNPSEEEEGYTVIEADVPQSEMGDFTTLLRQLTQGAGVYTFKFERYEPLPENLKQSVIDNSPLKKD